MSQPQHEMTVEWDVPLEMDDGVVLRADVFRPSEPGRLPVLMSQGPYGKGLHFEDGYPGAWAALCALYPDAVEGSSNAYANWETCDPERWVPEGYVVIRVDARGAGRSQGRLDPFSPREIRDYHAAIEWAAEQPWCNGKVGLSGISYYAVSQWLVAATRPPHLAAICPWEGLTDLYRDGMRHGGMANTFFKHWYESAVVALQHGVGERGYRSRATGELVSGPDTLSESELAANRIDLYAEIIERELLDEFHLDRTPDLAAIEVPVLSAGNWGGQGLHLRGNVEGFLRAGSAQRWLELHGHSHWAGYYTEYGRSVQRQFFDHFLKGMDNGWADRPAVVMQTRKVDGTFTERASTHWPPPETTWQQFRLTSDHALVGATADDEVQALVAFDATGEGLTFWTAPLEDELELCGPAVADLRVSSSTTDADLFVALRAFDPDGAEVLFAGAVDPQAPLSLGWLRASRRKLDPHRSTAYQPVHTHDERWPLTPGEPVDLSIEIWPTSVHLPRGYRIAITVRGTDFDHGLEGAKLGTYPNLMVGSGLFFHDDEADRPPDVFSGQTTLHVEQGGCTVTLPVRRS